MTPPTSHDDAIADAIAIRSALFGGDGVPRASLGTVDTPQPRDVIDEFAPHNALPALGSISADMISNALDEKIRARRAMRRVIERDINRLGRERETLVALRDGTLEEWYELRLDGLLEEGLIKRRALDDAEIGEAACPYEITDAGVTRIDALTQGIAHKESEHASFGGSFDA